MWHSTKKRKEPPESETTAVLTPGWKTSLPLDWTRMPKTDVCAGRPRRRPGRSSLQLSKASTLSTSTILLQGRAIVCLHDWNPSWVQGYFVARGSHKPWRMLGVQEEIDECLACDDGGYRRLTLTIYHDYVASNMSTTTSSSKKRIQIKGIEWTGGDMMNLYDTERNLEMMVADRLLTGEKCLIVVNKFFKGLVKQLRQSCQVDEDVGVLEFLPNLAIVTGYMALALPKEDENDDDGF